MKKNILVFCFVLLIITYLFGWRKNESEVILDLRNQTDIEQIKKLKLNGDIYPDGKAILYLIPEELEKLRETGFDFSISKSNLNSYYKNFWTREEAYHSYDEIITLMDSLATNFPAICQKTVYGTSVEGRELSALKISDNVQNDENEAEVMFDGGIHGDEIGCAENVIRFARDLCLNYGSDPMITDLINEREIWLYPMVNPDARVNMSRYNSNGVDLNRDWGYMWDSWGSSSGAYSQPESKALQTCMYENQFVIHTTYHSGTEYISYPWSYRSSSAPDQSHIDYLAALYSSSSGYSSLDYGQGNTGMYAINGSSKDTNYGVMGSVSWSMEISYSKQPPASQLMQYYGYNVPSMLAMIEYAGYGIEGIITDATTSEPVPAAVFINDYFPTYSDSTVGDFHKFLLAGTYSAKIIANGYQDLTLADIVVNSNEVTTLNIQLQPDQSHAVHKVVSSRIPGNNPADEGDTPAVIGMADNRNYSLGQNGWIILDMQTSVVNSAGNEFKVIEGDDTAESFSFYAGETMDGPWQLLGDGTGTTEFDLASSSLSQARFIKLLDDGDGSANVDNAGFDLDAVEVMTPISGPYLTIDDHFVDDSAGNGDGRIDPGETVDIVVTLINSGTENTENVNGAISLNDSYITLLDSLADFGDISVGMTAQNTFTLTADVSTPINHDITISLQIAENNGYSTTEEMNFIIGSNQILVVDLDGNHNSVTGLTQALDDNSVSYDLETSLPADLSQYEIIFVLLGIYDENHVLTADEGNLLADFLNDGGNLYLEGGDTWFYDSQTAVHSLFNINAESDGSSDLANINGQVDTFTENMNFSYSGDNNWIDHISAISPAENIFENDAPAYFCSVCYEDDNYKTIGASFEFGGLDDEILPSTKENLMHEILQFFEKEATPPQFSISISQLDFGNIFVGSDSTAFFTISNPGSSLLTGTITTPTDFSIQTNTENEISYYIEGNSNETFSLTFSPTNLGNYCDSLLITSNDPEQGTNYLIVNGNAIQPPEIEYSPTSFSLTLPPDQNAVETLQITNIGGSELNYQINFASVSERNNLLADNRILRSVRNNSWLSATPLSGCLSPSQTGNISLTFDAEDLAEAVYDTLLIISSNDPLQPACSLNINLIVDDGLQPEITIDPDNIELTLTQNNSWNETITVSNLGGEMLSYNASLDFSRIEQDGIRDPGDILLDLDVQTPTGDNQILGANFAGDHLWITGGYADGENQLYKFDQDGNLLQTYLQGTSSSWGMRDLAFDGTHLYSGDENGFYRIDPADGSVITLFTGNLGLGCIRALAYDDGNSCFYAASWSSDIIAFDETGTQLGILNNPDLTGIYGLAFQTGNLWIFDRSGNPETTFYEYEIDSQTLTGQSLQVPLLSGLTTQTNGGAFYSEVMISGKAVLGGIVQGGPLDRLFAIEVSDLVTWLEISANGSGTIASNGFSQDILLSFDTTDLDWGIYSALVNIASNDPFNPNSCVNIVLNVSQQLIPPQNISIQISEDDIILDWQEVPGAVNYLIYRSLQPHSGFDFLDETSTNSYLDIDAVNSNKYFYYITAE